MSFDEKLKKLRKENNLSQEELADKLKVSRQAVSKWESGSAYPEMEKLLEICKIFGVTLEELTNKEITIDEVNNKPKDYISSIGLYIKKTVIMFSNMSLFEILKVIITMFIIALCISLINIPINYIASIGNKIFLGFDNVVFALLNNLWCFLLNLVYVVGSVWLFLYIFKIKYLDNYVINSNSVKTEDSINIDSAKTEEKIVISNRKNNNGSTFIDFVTKIVMLGVKALVLFCSIPFIVATICAAFGIVILIWLFTKSIPLIGAFVGDIFLVILLILMLSLIFAFIFDHSVNVKKAIIIFVIGLLGLGIGCGVTVLELTRFDIVDRDITNLELNTDVKEYQFVNDLEIYAYSSNDIEYIANEELTNVVKIEVDYYKKLNTPYFNYYDDEIHIYSADDELTKEVVLDVIEGLKKNKIYNYSYYTNNKVRVYTSSNNINIIKNNIYNEENEDDYDD